MMAKVEIVSSRRQESLLPDGGTRPEYVVWLKTLKGATGSVTVPADVWDSEGLRDFLLAEADRLDRALSLDFE